MTGYQLFHKYWSTGYGGVAIYIKEINSSISRFNVPENCRPPGANTHDNLIDYLNAMPITSYSGVRFIVMWNRNKNFLNTQVNLRWIVTQPTHMGSILAVILTDTEWYVDSELHPLICFFRVFLKRVGWRSENCCTKDINQ